jgi:hypothetical protein
MVALHLPRGSGPEDLQGVSTFSHNEVNECKRVYSDAVIGPQRDITKAIDDLRKHRKVIQTSRQKLHAVCDKELKELKKADVKAGFGGLLSMNANKKIEEDDDHETVHHRKETVASAAEQASFRQLADKTDMSIQQIEDVFRIWMKYTDKSENITKKKLQDFLHELCPKRTIGENDLNAWWDQIHNKSFAECMHVDWTRADDSFADWRKATLGDDGERAVAEARIRPASFDEFIVWWSTCEVRPD